MRFAGKFKVILLGIVIVSISGVALIFMQNRRTVDQPLQEPRTDTGRAMMTMDSVHQTATKDGALQWELRAESAELEAESGRMVLKAPRVVFFLEDGAKVNLSADKGFLDTRNNDITVQGNVRVLGDRYTLSADTLDYKHAARQLQSQTPVHIKGEAIDLTSQNMTYDLESQRAQFNGRVRGNLHEGLPL